MVLTSCGKETLIPFVSPMTLNQLTDNRPLEFSYKTDETKLDEFGEDLAKFPLFGKIFQSMAHILANTAVKTKKGLTIDLESIDIELASYKDVDLKYIDWMKFDLLKVELVPGPMAGKKLENLDFIEKIEISAQLDEGVEGAHTINKEGNVLLVSYDKKKDQLGCEKKCVELKIQNINWKSILTKNKHIRLVPKVLINSVPKSTMKLSAEVKFSLKLNLGF